MKNVLLISLLFVMACGKGGGGPGSTSFPDKPPTNVTNPPAKNNYRIVVTGDNVQFVSNSFDLDVGYADHSQYAIAPAVTVPAGSQFELDETQFNLQNLVIQVMNMNGTASMTATLYKNGSVVESTTLFSAGNFHNFSNW